MSVRVLFYPCSNAQRSALILNNFIPTRAAGLAALERFVPRAGRHYTDQRNYDYGPGDRSNISCLSPYLRYRLITEAEVIDAVLARHSFAAAEKFVQEVCWRTYWKGWLEQRPAVWDRYLEDVADLERHSGTEYQNAINGQTGIDCFDAWVSELKQYGYLHNHARMWFASIWIFTLKLPWQLGAAFFYHHLIDADPASNTLSWRWVAGLQTVGKTYLAREDNIIKYTNGRFRSKGLATTSIAFDEKPIEAPQDFARGAALPKERFGLLIIQEDLHPESLINGQSEVAAIATAATPNQQSSTVNSFITEALADAGTRASSFFKAPHQHLDTLDPTSIVNWMERSGLNTIVTSHMPTGETHTQSEDIRRVLRTKNLELITLQRRWDSQAWPNARKGFFAFREKIPKLIIAD
jgi:deoxyribodipyrimidine photo-lyase